jgi:hypothetical protein
MQHQWVAITQQNVITLDDGEGDPVIFADPEDKPRTAYGCKRCDVSMVEGYDTECPGVPDDNDE